MTAPSGLYSHAKEQLKTLLAATAAFQTWVDADDADEAAASIYFDELPPPAQGASYSKTELTSYRPLVFISYPEDGGHRMRRIAEASGGQVPLTGGTLIMHFEWNTPEAQLSDTAEAIRLLENSIGDIVEDMWELTGTSQPSPSTDCYLDLAGTDLLMSARRVDKAFVNDDGDHLAIVLRVDWGRSL